MTDEIVDRRVLRLKNGQRLPPPHDMFAVCDRGGCIGFRILALSGGPTSDGVEAYSEFTRELRPNESPIECYKEALFKDLPTFRPKVQNAKMDESCGATQPRWERGSWKELTEDLTAIVRMTAVRFQAPLQRGHLMMCVYSQNECWDARLTVDPAEVSMEQDVRRVCALGRGWLLEDLARLAPGILHRNLPIGCGSRGLFLNDHTHQPIRITAMATFDGAASPHESMASSERYDGIVAAASENGAEA